MLKTFPYLLLCIGFFYSCTPAEDHNPEHDLSLEEHPRLLWLENEEQQIWDLIEADETWLKVHTLILEESDKILEQPILERELVGYRLLATSRELLKRMFFLSYSYRMTEDRRYLWKARDELLAVSKFYNWNPSHFLDVAEMTMGVALGYDWLYDDLSNNTRYAIKNAIINKGLVPSKNTKFNWWLDSDMNWNPVCNAGMVFGALAIYEDYPELAKEYIDRAFESIPVALEAYEPDGVYPEGYVYWKYGTEFLNLFFSAIQKADIEGRGLQSSYGLMQSSHFMKHTLAPSGLSFNWGDCPTWTNLSPAMFWFADFMQDPSLLWSEKKFLEVEDLSALADVRILPVLLIWSKGINTSNIAAPKELFWSGQGPNPVAMMRTSWEDPNAIYLGFKAGTPGYVHAHMDVGSFVMEAEGVRWAADLGKVVYEDLESQGLYIFGTTQSAERWKIFRMSTYAHNVLIINNEQQRVDGYAKIDRYSDQPSFMYAVSDISTLYDDQLSKAVRGTGIKDGKFVVVRDEIKTLNQVAAVVRWNMVTSAEVELGQNIATLTYGDKKLFLKVQGPENLQMMTWSTAPTTSYDPENPGTIMVGFECEVPVVTSESFEVILVPERFEAEADFTNISLDDWQ